MKTLLICPALRPAVPQLAEDAPLALAPILGESLVCHWIEHLALCGATEVRILASDRAADVGAAVGDGARWGVKVEVVPGAYELSPAEAAAAHRPAGEPGWLPAPHDIVPMSHLPGAAGLPLFESYAGWYAALLAWMPQALTPARVRVSEILPGIWVGRRARVAPTATLVAPCWIGDQVFVEPHAVVGPGAIVEDRAVVERNARVIQSWVGPDTFVGRLTVVAGSLACGGTLTNWQTDSSLRVPDPFLLCSLAHPQPATTAAAPRAVRAVSAASRAPVLPGHALDQPL
ncbi:MAG TPA: hypothetical protein VG838_13860 [Opitutaceae bacterium]|nr:hypothetical protein [Opitutaceae bacterium]